MILQSSIYFTLGVTWEVWLNLHNDGAPTLKTPLGLSLDEGSLLCAIICLREQSRNMLLALERRKYLSTIITSLRSRICFQQVET